MLLRKREDGALEAFEVPDRDEARLGRLVPPQTQLALLLSAGDVAAVGAAVEPGSTAVCLVWENLWAAPFTAAVRQAGGQMVAGGRIPVPALLAAVDELTDEQPELDLPLSTRRAGPPSVLGGACRTHGGDSGNRRSGCLRGEPPAGWTATAEGR